MKTDIHPKYKDMTITCACGATYEVGSTGEGLRIDICAACHPLFTGKEKLMDAEGRVEKFRKKYTGIQPRPKIKPVAKAVVAAPKAVKKPKPLKTATTSPQAAKAAEPAPKAS